MKFWFTRGAWVSKKTQEKYKNIVPDEIKSIAIIRHAALGDMILTRAFIGEARKFFPNASITLSVVSNYNYGVPSDMVDRVHVAIGSDQRHISKRDQIKKAKELGYHDIIFDMTVSTRSLLLCLVNKAGIKVSFPYRNWQRIFYDICICRSDMQFEAETLLDMLRLFGANVSMPPNSHINVPATKRDKPYFIYFTTASIANKCWPVENFAELLKKLSSQYSGYNHIVLEGLAEWESVSNLIDLATSRGEIKNIQVQKAMQLDETYAFLKGAVAVIGNDTGIRNLAICCETPTIGIFSSVVLYRYWPRYGNHDVVYNADGSIPSVDDVLASVNKLVKI